MRKLITLVICLIIVSAFYKCSDAHDHSTVQHHVDHNHAYKSSISPDFAPAYYNHIDTYHLSAEPDTVFPFFQPEWRKLWRSDWHQKPIFRRPNEDKAWAVDHIEHHENSPIEIFVIVTYINDAEREIRYTIIWGGLEIQKFRINCKPGSSGGTDATIRTMTYGLNDFGNMAVTEYINRGNPHKQNISYVKAIEDYLKK